NKEDIHIKGKQKKKGKQDTHLLNTLKRDPDKNITWRLAAGEEIRMGSGQGQLGGAAVTPL
ncbi:MAG: hypothetical protein OQK92_00540, partial [Sedimenticola sp.]|nr:hypothetical protein [Sedimenticola sp.]MCW8947949.1 hypothetical protein [Sedimenticola sp.]